MYLVGRRAAKLYFRRQTLYLISCSGLLNITDFHSWAIQRISAAVPGYLDMLLGTQPGRGRHCGSVTSHSSRATGNARLAYTASASLESCPLDGRFTNLAARPRPMEFARPHCLDISRQRITAGAVAIAEWLLR